MGFIQQSMDHQSIILEIRRFSNTFGLDFVREMAHLRTDADSCQQRMKNEKMVFEVEKAKASRIFEFVAN